MELRVIGCHGGETPKHRTSAFVVDDRLAIDAGSLTSGMELKAQCALEAVLVSHAHLDHVRDLATIADNRSQNGAGAARGARRRRQTIAHPAEALLQRPALARLLEDPQRRRPDHPLPRAVSPRSRHGHRRLRGAAIRVNHTIDGARSPSRARRRARLQRRHRADRPPLGGAQRDAGPAGPADGSELPQRRGAAGPRERPPHARDARASTSSKLGLQRAKELPTLLYHIKPSFQARWSGSAASSRG